MPSNTTLAPVHTSGHLTTPTPLTLFRVERNLSLYEIQLRCGVDYRMLSLLDKGLIARPNFVALARLDMLGIPIMSWAGVPVIKQAIMNRRTRKEIMASNSRRVGAYL